MNIKNIKEYLQKIQESADYIYENSEFGSLIENESESILESTEYLKSELEIGDVDE